MRRGKGKGEGTGKQREAPLYISLAGNRGVVLPLQIVLNKCALLFHPFNAIFFP